MSQPGALSRNVLAVIWLVLGLVMVGVPVWLGWTRWRVILAGHPALMVGTLLCALIGLVALAWAIASLIVGGRLDREGDRDHPRGRTRAQLVRRARLRIGFAIPALLVCVALVGVLGYARPFQATAPAVAALVTDDKARVADRLGWYELLPTATDPNGNVIKPTAGFVFYPGARVDSRAYAHVLRPLAETGFLVVVLKAPLGFALLDADQAAAPIAAHPEIATWAVGGHSLGGVAAASFADTHPTIKGLVLYASYPAQPMVRTDLKVLSVSATEDGLIPVPLKENLPPGTVYAEIPGAVHSTFGDYGDQPGDGVATGDRAAAQAQIGQLTQGFLAGLLPPKPAKKK